MTQEIPPNTSWAHMRLTWDYVYLPSEGVGWFLPITFQRGSVFGLDILRCLVPNPLWAMIAKGPLAGGEGSAGYVIDSACLPGIKQNTPLGGVSQLVESAIVCLENKKSPEGD